MDFKKSNFYARGGTEIQFDKLYQYVDNELLNHFQITTSIPEKIPLSKDKINILWVQNSYDQPNLAPWFKNKENHKKYDFYVFVSNWCYEQYRKYFDIDTKRCVVIKNAIDHFPKIIKYKKGDPFKLIFQPTPWRGLNVFLGAMQKIKNPNITADVFSSTEIYGSHFNENNYEEFKPLFDQAKKLPNVNYIGYKPNGYIMENIHNYQCFAYPNIWEETSCISAIEALGAGLSTILTNYGALYETGTDFSIYVPYQKDWRYLAELFAYSIEETYKRLHREEVQNFLVGQQDYYKKFYSWEKRKHEWTDFLQGVHGSKNK